MNQSTTSQFHSTFTRNRESLAELLSRKLINKYTAQLPVSSSLTYPPNTTDQSSNNQSSHSIDHKEPDDQQSIQNIVRQQVETFLKTTKVNEVTLKQLDQRIAIEIAIKDNSKTQIEQPQPITIVDEVPQEYTEVKLNPIIQQQDDQQSFFSQRSKSQVLPLVQASVAKFEQSYDKMSSHSKMSKRSNLSGFLSEINEWQAIQKHDLLEEMKQREQKQLNTKLAQIKFRKDLDNQKQEFVEKALKHKQEMKSYSKLIEQQDNEALAREQKLKEEQVLKQQKLDSERQALTQAQIYQMQQLRVRTKEEEIEIVKQIKVEVEKEKYKLQLKKERDFERMKQFQEEAKQIKLKRQHDLMLDRQKDVEFTKEYAKILDEQEVKRQVELAKIANKGDQYQDNFLEQVLAVEKTREEKRDSALKMYIEKLEKQKIDREKVDLQDREARKSQFLRVITEQQEEKRKKFELDKLAEIEYAKYVQEQVVSKEEQEQKRKQEERAKRILNAAQVRQQREQDFELKRSPLRMNKEELRINRDILKTVLSEKKQGLLDNIYIKSALPTITK